MKRTKDVMFIYWWNAKAGWHEETPGIYLFAATPDSEVISSFNQKLGVFVNSHRIADGYRIMPVDSENGLKIAEISIKLKTNLETGEVEGDYLVFVKELLSFCLESNFDLAWIGVDYESDYEDLFFEGQTIYAAASKELGVITTSEWDEQLQIIDSSTVAQFRQESIQLLQKTNER